MNTATRAPVTGTVGGELLLPIEQVRIARENVRELDEQHVNSLAESIKLRGVLVPPIVREASDVCETRGRPALLVVQGESADRLPGRSRVARRGRAAVASSAAG
jgi:ParB-like nuclease domain